MPPLPGGPAWVLVDVAIILAVAHTLGALCRRLGQPAVVGEMVAGVLLGPTLLGPDLSSRLFPPSARPALGMLGQAGLVSFVFLVGLEIDWTGIRDRARTIALVGGGVVALALALGVGLQPVLAVPPFVGGSGMPAQVPARAFVLITGALLSTTAFPVTARILQDKGLIHSPIGAVAVVTSAAVTLLAFLVAAAAGGGESLTAGRLVAGGAYLAVLLLGVRPALAPLGRAYRDKGRLTPGLLAAILAVVLVSCAAARLAGIHVMVGGFLTGAVMPARERLSGDLSARLGGVTNAVLLPVFLAVSGLHTDFGGLGVEALPGVGAFLFAGIGGHWLGGAVLGRLGGLGWAEANLLGVLLNCRGLVILVVALAARDEGLIGAPLQAAAVLLALVTTAMTGPLVDAFVPRLTRRQPGRRRRP